MKKIILFTLIVIIACGFGKCKKSSEETLRDRAPIVLPSPLPVQWNYVTTQGALVGGNLELPDSDRDIFLADVQAGIDQTLVNTSCLGYINWRDPAAFTVIYERPTSYSFEGNCPTLNMKNGQKIAGTVIGVGDLILSPPFIYIAYEPTTSAFCREFRRNAVQYEAEHIEAWFNDQTLFWQRTGVNDYHPIYSPCSENNKPYKFTPKSAIGKGIDWNFYRDQMKNKAEK